jgi:predicted protein tyrosine phosphatase
MNINSRKNPKRLALNLLSPPVSANNTLSKCDDQGSTIIMQNPIYYQEGPACILPNLYLGAHYNACNVAQLARHQISCVINVASEIAMAPSQVEYHHLRWTHSQNNLSQSEFDRAIELIETAHYKNQIVLVHCQQGIERSAALVLAFLLRSSYRMKRVTVTAANVVKQLAGQNWSLDQALAFVQEKAPGIRPNMQLLYQLREYEKKLLDACSQQQCQQQRQHSIQTRTRRSGSMGCSKPTAAITASSSLRASALLGCQRRPRSASLRELSLSASAISIKNEISVAKRKKMQIIPVLQQTEKTSRNKSVLALVCVLVLLAAAMYQRKLQMYHHNIKTNQHLAFTMCDISDDSLALKNNSVTDTNHLNLISLFKPVYPVF